MHKYVKLVIMIFLHICEVLCSNNVMCVGVQDVGMGDKAITSFLGCCVQLLQILMEVTGVLTKNQCPLSFINYYVSKRIYEKSMHNDQRLA